jgi:hypothetical protein
MRQEGGTNKGCAAQGKRKDESAGKNERSAAANGRAAIFEGQRGQISILVCAQCAIRPGQDFIG